MSAPIHPETFAEDSARIGVTRRQARQLGRLATDAERLHRAALLLVMACDDLAVDLDADLSPDFDDLLLAADAVSTALILFADLVGHAFAAAAIDRQQARQQGGGTP